MNAYVISFFCALALWALFSWPLPRRVFTGIPSSAHNTEKDNVRSMIAGDHLQLMYHFWLFGDMLAGKTPFFHNIYEFNLGDDEARYSPSAYYFPFSLLYAIGSFPATRAFGWNFAGFVSLWMTCFLTWLLARRYTPNEWIACSAGLISIALPYRWHTLFGGSPTGFAIVWIPMLFLGLDMAVREYRLSGGIIAGLAILFAGWTDTHVFFFGALAAPCWCLVAFLKRETFDWGSSREYFRLCRALVPAALFLAGAYLLTNAMSREMSASVTAAGRTLHEVTLSSPSHYGLFSQKTLGVSNHIYIGYVIPGVIAGGLALLGWRVLRRPREFARSALPTALLIVGILAVICLALGTRGPFHSRLFTQTRKIITPYAMVRQPAKIFCLMPTFLGVAWAMALSQIQRVSGKTTFRTSQANDLGNARDRDIRNSKLEIRNSRKRNNPIANFKFQISNLKSLSLAVVVVLGILEYKSRINATICELRMERPAYKAIADDARAGNKKPHALIIPLWPGDSHWASLYQHYVSLYRIRMVNGYGPFVSKNYFDNVFRKFESGNQGCMYESQLDALQAMGVGYIVFHEDAFPQKVSPLPARFTLKGLLNTPRLKLLQRDGPISAFKILARPEEDDI